MVRLLHLLSTLRLALGLVLWMCCQQQALAQASGNYPLPPIVSALPLAATSPIGASGFSARYGSGEKVASVTWSAEEEFSSRVVDPGQLDRARDAYIQKVKGNRPSTIETNILELSRNTLNGYKAGFSMAHIRTISGARRIDEYVYVTAHKQRALIFRYSGPDRDETKRAAEEFVTQLAPLFR